jgi:hypothetical protein
MPDFGIMRGFNEKLFGDKLVAGQLPTLLGLIGSQEVTDTDPDAQAFFDRVTAAGGSLSTTEKQAVNQLVLDLKANSLWTPMKAIYPMVGASAAACAQNLKSSSFTGTFTSTGWTFASTGVTPNGSSAYMNTGFAPSTQFANNINNHLSHYSRTQSGGSVYDMNVYDGSNEFGLTQYYQGVSLKFLNAYGYPQDCAGANNSNTKGFLIGTRTANNFARAFFNGSTLGTQTNTLSTSRPIYPIYIGATNLLNTGAYQYSNRECAFASIGDGLSDTQASNFYTAVQAFQTTLSRQV